MLVERQFQPPLPKNGTHFAIHLIIFSFKQILALDRNLLYVLCPILFYVYN